VPYSNTVTSLDTEGGPLSTKLVARLWKLQSDTWGSHGYDQEQEHSPQLDVRLDETNPTPVSFTTAATYPNRPVGLTIQDASRVVPLGINLHPGPNETGWLFRSGAFANALPTTAPIDLIAARDEIVAADLPALFPSPPVQVDADTSITQITPTLADPLSANVGGGIDFTLQGTWTGGVGFTYSGRFVPTPGTDISEPNSESVIVTFENENHQFLGGASPPNENLLWGALWTYTNDTLLPAVRSNIEAHVSRRITSAVGTTLSGSLPAGVILSVRTVSATAQRLQIRGVLGSFGNVAPKLQQAGGGGGKKCFIASAAYGSELAPEVQFLRELRDDVLRATEWGREFFESYWRHYYRISPPIAHEMERDPALRRLVRWSIVQPWTAYMKLLVARPDWDRVDMDALEPDLRTFLVQLRDEMETWLAGIELPRSFEGVPPGEAVDELNVILGYIKRTGGRAYLEELHQRGALPLACDPEETEALTARLRCAGRSEDEVELILYRGTPQP
jgi:hypothetical protein